MIADCLDRWSSYFAPDGWQEAFDRLRRFDATAEDGTYEIQGRDVFARVMTYETRHEAASIIESHREYIDIQAALDGAERIAWFPVEGLSMLAPYDPANDVIHYAHPSAAAGEVILEPGRFVVLFPTDAHMPQLAAGAPRVIKKVVVKLRVSAARERQCRVE